MLTHAFFQLQIDDFSPCFLQNLVNNAASGLFFCRIMYYNKGEI